MKNPNKRPIRVLLLGYPYFVNRLQELGQGSKLDLMTLPKSRFGRLLALWQADLIYQIGGDLRPNRFSSLAILLGKRILIHWVGSDILQMREWRAQGGRFAKLLLEKVAHWAEVDWTAAELADLGVVARIVPLVPANLATTVAELPDKFVALSYLPSQKAQLYGEADLLKLAREYPEVTFLAVASDPTARPADWPENLISVGWVNDMAELYAEITVLIRLTEHDGLSFMVLEALAHGRQVIWSYPLPGVRSVNGYQELSQVVSELYQLHLAGKLQLNQVGRELVLRDYQPEVVWQKIEAGIKEVLGR